MMDIGKDLQNAYEEGYKQGYEQGEKDALYMAIEALSEKTSTIQEKHQLSEETSTNTSTKSTNISTDASADRPRGEWLETAQDYYETVNKKGGGVNENTEYFTDDIACPNCLAKFSNIDNETERFNFCPNCGADMRGNND